MNNECKIFFVHVYKWECPINLCFTDLGTRNVNLSYYKCIVLFQLLQNDLKFLVLSAHIWSTSIIDLQ